MNIDPATWHGLYRLADYPVLQAFASKQTEATQLDGRACHAIYAQSLPNVDWTQVSDQELAFMRALGAAMTREELIAAVPAHLSNEGRPYFVVIDDIPEPWREQYWRALYACNCPVVEGFGRCSHFWDWDAWVHGSWRGISRGPEGLLPSSYRDKDTSLSR